MFTDLAFVDWIALVFAAVLLAGAAAAAIVAYASASARDKWSGPFSSTSQAAPAERPSVGSVIRDDGARSAKAAESTDIDEPAHAEEQTLEDLPGEVVIDLSDDQAEVDLSSHVPQHAVPAGGPSEAVDESFVHQPFVNTVVRSTPDPAVRLAERAARLRGRPVPETKGDPSRKRVVSAVTPQRTPAHAKSIGYQDPSPAASASDVQSTDGFPARAPGFFDDPLGRHELRYWDGSRWTEYVKERGERFIDPL